ncbi:MAG: peptidylprolyl isomerase, partial [Polyangiales bacterium]
DAEVEAYYERERSRFARPARITGTHVFFSKDLRQSAALAAARAAKAELDAGALEPQQAVGLGDVSPSGAQFEGKLARQLASRFGEEFAKTAESLPEGQWSGPIETPFGAHLLLVQERTQPQTPPLPEIRARVAAVYKSSQRQVRLATAMEELRARYQVVVE